MGLERNEPTRVDGGLRQDDGLFQALFSQAAVGMAQTSLTGEWLLVNNRLCEILGYSQAELTAKTFSEVTHPDDREASLDAMRQLLSGEISSWLREKRYIRKYGTVVWVRLFVSLVRDSTNQPLYFIAVVEEVTDRILAERALEESKQQLRLALTTGLGVWECDLRQNSVVVSPQYRKVFGYSPLSYAEWMKLIHPDDLARVVAVAREGVERAGEWEAEFRVCWPDGTVRWMLSKAKVILDDNRRPARMVGISLDITERKRAEEQRSHLAAIVESADVAIVGEALDGTIMSWNRGAEMLYGYKAEEILGRHISMLVPQDRQNRIGAVLETLRRDERIEQFETIRVRKDGHLFPVCITLSSVRDSSGAVIGALAISRDITAQKQAEALLRQSEERFRATFFQAAVGITQTGRDGDWLLLNDRFCEILGYSQAELLEKTWLDVTHPDDREASLSAVRQLKAGEISSWSTEKRYIRKDGTTVWARLVTSVVRDEHNQPQYAISVVEDVTERKRAEANLRESEERFRNMADSAPFGLWLTGPDGMVTYFNKIAFEFSGLTAQSGEGDWTELIHPDDRPACQSAYSSAVTERRGFRIECRIRRADGKYRWVLCSGVPRFSADGLFAGHLGTSVDITHVRRVHEAAMSAQKLESLGGLAAGIAHDFNNLLGSILAQAELAETDLASDLMPNEEIQSIKSVAIRGAEIVRELMVYAGQEQPTLVEAVDLSRLVEEIPELLKLSISKHAVLRTDLASDLPSVPGNAAQLRQAVMNLVINASESIGEQQGIIKVTTAQVGSNSVLLEVSDNGCGMTEAIMARIFEPFFSTKFAGRGLGLAVVQGVVRAHGGDIKLRSTPAEGTTFQVFLPCISEAATKIEAAITSVAAVPRSRVGVATVLVVEDEETLRSALRKDLRRRGYVVVEASNGHEAIQVFGNSRNKLDAVLLDLTIPGASSREVLYQLQAARPDLKVIVTSAYSKEACDAFFAGLRIDHFMRKPFQLSEVAGILEGVCRPANLQPRVPDD